MNAYPYVIVCTATRSLSALVCWSHPSLHHSAACGHAGNAAVFVLVSRCQLAVSSSCWKISNYKIITTPFCASKAVCWNPNSAKIFCMLSWPSGCVLFTCYSLCFCFFFCNYFLIMRDGCSWVSIACRGIKSWMLQMRSQVSAKAVLRGFVIYCDTGSFHGCFGLLLYFPQGFPCCSKGCICFACGASRGV